MTGITIRFARYYYKEFRQRLVQEVADDAEVSYLRVPFAEIDFGDDVIMANVMILEKPRTICEYIEIYENDIQEVKHFILANGFTYH